MTGTQNHEGLAGVVAAIDYLADIGGASSSDRRARLRAALTAIAAYEGDLGRRLLDALAERSRFKVWGITDPARQARRVPTIALTMADRPALALAEHLAARGIYTWHGNLYALGLAERLGVEQRGGFLRLGLVHYNTVEEVERVVAALDEV